MLNEVVTFFNKKEKLPIDYKNKVKENNVSVKQNIVFSFLPILVLYAYLRIEKFWLGFLVHLGTWIVLFVTCIFLASLLHDNSSLLVTVLVGWGIAGTIGFYLYVHIYTLMKWTREWNKKVDEFNRGLDEYTRTVKEKEMKDDESKGVKL